MAPRVCTGDLRDWRSVCVPSIVLCQVLRLHAPDGLEPEAGDAWESASDGDNSDDGDGDDGGYGLSVRDAVALAASAGAATVASQLAHLTDKLRSAQTHPADAPSRAALSWVRMT
jgi:hypothetical protein